MMIEFWFSSSNRIPSICFSISVHYSLTKHFKNILQYVTFYKITDESKYEADIEEKHVCAREPNPNA